jgi:hypothetical protein
VGLLLATRREPVTLHLAGVLATRSLGFALFLWSFFSVLGLLGRYRTPLLLALTVGLLVAMRDFEPHRVGPFALVVGDFASEGPVLPAGDLLWTGGASAGLLALAFAMGLAREGSVAAALALSMSRRERAFLVGGALAALTALGAFEERLLREPLQLPEAATVETEGVAVAVSRNRPEDTEAEALAHRLHVELSALRSYLGLAALPRLLVARREDLDPGVYELATGADPSGVLVRVRHPHAHWNERDFVAWLVPYLLDQRSRGRLLKEPKRWIAEGVGHFWARREAAGTPLSRVPDLTLCALYGADQPLARDDLDRWLLVKERHGEEVSTALAWSGLAVLAQVRSAEAAQSLLRAVLAETPPRDARALWHEWRFPLERLLVERAGISYAELIRAWNSALETERIARRAELERLPRLAGDLLLVPLARTSYRLELRVGADPPLPQDAWVRFLYSSLPPFDLEIAPVEARAEELSFGAASQGHSLPGTWARGERVGWTVAHEPPGLGCELVSGWQRRSIP